MICVSMPFCNPAVQRCQFQHHGQHQGLTHGVKDENITLISCCVSKKISNNKNFTQGQNAGLVS